VRADKLRFDFSYHEPVGPARLAEVEDLVNRRIVENHSVRVFTTSQDHARDLGATALFGEKYGDFVRVVEIDDFSRELCGGTHVGGTSELGIFKIVSEGSVGANVRRIEALCGRSAVSYFRDRDRLIGKAVERLGVAGDQLLPAIDKVQAKVSQLEDEVQHYLLGSSKDIVDTLVHQAVAIDGVNVVAQVLDVRDMDHLLSLVDEVRDRVQPAVVALGASLDGKASLVVSVSRGVDSIHAGQVVREATQLGRGGGGDPSRLVDAIEVALSVIRGSLAG
jgi:alanyl-tRNA synthetase